MPIDPELMMKAWEKKQKEKKEKKEEAVEEAREMAEERKTWEEAKEEIPELEEHEPQEEYRGQEFSMEVWREYLEEAREGGESEGGQEPYYEDWHKEVRYKVDAGFSDENIIQDIPVHYPEVSKKEVKEYLREYKFGEGGSHSSGGESEESRSSSEEGFWEELEKVETEAEALKERLPTYWTVTPSIVGPEVKTVTATRKTRERRVTIGKPELTEIGDWQEEFGYELKEMIARTNKGSEHEIVFEKRED